MAGCRDLSSGNKLKEQAKFLRDWMNFVSKSCCFSSDTLHTDCFARSFTALLSWQWSNIKAPRDSEHIHIHSSSLINRLFITVKQYLKLHLMNLVILRVVFLLYS